MVGYEVTRLRDRRRLTRRAFVASSLSAACLPFAGLPAKSQSSDPYRVVIAFPPGGTSTASMQPLIAPVSETLGAAITLDYKPGAGGDLAGMTVAKAAPDGRTLFFGHAGPLAINAHMNPKNLFDPLNDFIPLTLVVDFPIILCVRSDLRVDNFKDFISLAKSRKLYTGSSGYGSIQHLAGELLRHSYGFQTVHLQYLGGGPLQDAINSGLLEFVCETGANVVKHVQDKRLTAIAVMANERLQMLPQVPTFGEIGVKDFNISAWFGLLAPAKTPDEVCAKINDAVTSALGLSNVQAALKDVGGIPGKLHTAGFAEFIKSESQRWGKVIKDAGLKRPEN